MKFAAWWSNFIRGHGESIPTDLPPECIRLVQATGNVAARPNCGPGDLAALVRQVLRMSDERSGRDGTETIEVPDRPGWPNREFCERSGLTVLANIPGALVVRARRWRPEWLPHSDRFPPDRAAFALEVRRVDESILGDPFLRVMGRDRYRCPGQREAIRGILSAPPGATIAVNLPTGSGKSLCAQLPALLPPTAQGGPPGVTVVAVPTVALALDQQRAVSSFVPHATAYCGDSSEESRTAAASIRDRIRTGEQRIVFAAPEAVCGSLVAPLFAAARAGRLRMLVVDEAHIVAQWGDGFRPAFQELAGVRRGLLREAAAGGRPSFLTVLLSATMTQVAVETLELLFGDPGPFRILSAAHLRPEPEYWIARCPDDEVRSIRLVEALHHLPRPLIVYVTLPTDVVRRSEQFRTAGFQRIDGVHGQSTRQQRQRVLDRLRSREIDVIVATSAFGLGVDQDDVRAVVHACVPETLDRFYQEVGRGGRDGRAAVSLMLYEASDLPVAENLAKTTYIGAERGRERWQSLYEDREVLPEGVMRIKLDRAPNRRDVDMAASRKRNPEWNTRTLTLMCLSDLIRLDWEPPNQVEADLSAVPESEDTPRESSARPTRVVRILDAAHLHESTWESRVENVRVRRMSQGWRGFELMRSALEGQRCIADSLHDAYSVPSGGARGGSIVMVRACGGCPWCRTKGLDPNIGATPYPRPLWRDLKVEVEQGLSRILRNHPLVGVFYEGEWKDLERLDWLLSSLVAAGIRNFALSKMEQRMLLERAIEENPGRRVYVGGEDDLAGLPPGPVVVVPSSERACPAAILRAGADVERTGAMIAFFPANTAHPDRAHRRLADTLPGRSVAFETFLREVEDS